MNTELTSVEVHEYIKELYAPKDVVNNSDMDTDTFQYLVALNNKGYNAHEVKLTDRISMNTLDEAIKYKDLYYLEILIEANTLTYSFWMYPKKTSGDILHTSSKPFKIYQKKHLNKLTELAKLLELELIEPL